MSIVTDATVSDIVFGVLFLIPWYRYRSLIGINCASLRLANDSHQTNVILAAVFGIDFSRSDN